MHKQILDNIEMGVLVVNRQLKISYWNRWLAIHTRVSRESAVHNNLEKLFPNFSFELLKQKIHIALKLGTPTFLNGKISKYVLPIDQYKITKSIFRHMRQDVTLTPINEEEVSIVINDVSVLLEAQYTIDCQLELLERQAKTDSLTGCFNRNMFDSMLSTEIKRCERHEHVFSLILFDIDDFKQVNDSHGHLVGDTVLKQMALVVGNSIRQSDALIRWGGEEFFILLPETELGGAALLAEKQRQQVWDHDFERAGRLSCSYGVVQWERAVTADDIISRADRALYMSKNSGKNKVFVYADEACLPWTMSLAAPPISPSSNK